MIPFSLRVRGERTYLNNLIPASNEPSAVLARAFGECREGQQPRCSAAGLLTCPKPGECFPGFGQIYMGKFRAWSAISAER